MKALEHLLQLAKQLEPSFAEIDQGHSRKLAANIEQVFSSTLFNTENRTASGFLACFEANVQRAMRLSEQGKQAQLKLLVEEIQHQADALVKFRSVCQLLLKEQRYQKQKWKGRGYEKQVKQVVGNSQALYQELAQHHVWQQQLQEMLNQAQLDALQDNSPLKQKKVQAVNERLLRCRKATANIEYQIQQLERPRD